MRRGLPSAALLVVPALLGGGACASARLAYAPDEFRGEVGRRAPAVRPDEVVVPFAVGPEQAAMARAVTAPGKTDTERTRLLLAAFFDPARFGVRYAWTVTATAEETLRHKEGNCLSLASAFVGLARAAGLRAYYIDASIRVTERRQGERLAVSSGHVTAMVEAEGERIGLDFGRMGPIRWYRVMDDLEALAHFHNNRGYDLLEEAADIGRPADWARAWHEFWLAVQIAPGFARGWNNLGLAAGHLGRDDEAIVDYGNAIRADPALAAPRNNLGSLRFRRGELAQALPLLEEAARLDPSGPHILYNLALARRDSGDREGAVQALQRAIEIRGIYPEAKSMLDLLAIGPEREKER